MNIEEMKTHEWSVSWSGGKDSTASIILLHERNIPIKEIVYVRMMYAEGIPATLPVMNDFIDEAVKTFRRWGYKVTVINSIKTAKEICERKYKRSKYPDRIGKCYGIAAFTRGRCWMQIVKRKTIDSIAEGDWQIVGIAADERERLVRMRDRQESILCVEQYKEKDCFDLCRKYGLLSPMYELGITRDGCWFCPNAAKRQRELIKNEYPELYEEIVKMIEMTDYSLESITKNDRNKWLRDYLAEKQQIKMEGF